MILEVENITYEFNLALSRALYHYKSLLDRYKVRLNANAKEEYLSRYWKPMNRAEDDIELMVKTAEMNGIKINSKSLEAIERLNARHEKYMIMTRG